MIQINQLPRIWNRNFYDWLNLTFGVLNIGVALLPYNPISFLNYIVSGFGISAFISGGFINTLFRLNQKQLTLGMKQNEIISKLTKELEESKKNENKNKRK